MRARVWMVLGAGVVLSGAPLWAAGGRYDPDYPVCMEAMSSEGTRIDCIYMSLEQCRQGTFGSSGTCFNNPNYVPRPAEAAPAPAQTEPALAAKPGKSAGRYDPAYPVCMEVYGADGSRIECFFTSMEQCKLGATGTAGLCFNNPYYVAPKPAPEPTQQAQSAPPPPKSSKTASKKSRRTAEPPGSSPTPTRSQ